MTGDACIEVLALFTGDEPLVVSDGRVVRTRGELEDLCRGSESGIVRVQLEITRSDAHMLSSDAAYLVREGNLVYTVDGEPPTELRHSSTIIFRRTPDGWKQMHYHESHRSPDDG